MSEPLLRIENHHSPNCGDPSIVNSGDENCYIGYFENEHGEQWIFKLNRKTGEAILRGGDVGWNTDMEVINGQVDDLILDIYERTWLQACWLAGMKTRK